MDESFADVRAEITELMHEIRCGMAMPATPDGITHAEVRAMMAIADVTRVHSQTRPSRVAEQAHTTPSALSQTLRVLEKKGLIERCRTGEDFRGVQVSLTEKGRRLAKEGARMRDEHFDSVMAYVGQEDMNHLARILRKILAYNKQDIRRDRDA